MKVAMKVAMKSFTPVYIRHKTFSVLDGKLNGSDSGTDANFHLQSTVNLCMILHISL